MKWTGDPGRQGERPGLSLQVLISHSTSPSANRSHITHRCFLKANVNCFPWEAPYLSRGTSPPPSWTTVGKTSMRLVGSETTRLAGSTPGQRKMPGTRIPPSQPPMPLPPAVTEEEEREWLNQLWLLTLPDRTFRLVFKLLLSLSVWLCVSLSDAIAPWQIL